MSKEQGARSKEQESRIKLNSAFPHNIISTPHQSPISTKVDQFEFSKELQLHEISVTLCYKMLDNLMVLDLRKTLQRTPGANHQCSSPWASAQHLGST